jgi:hypothetical protein
MPDRVVRAGINTSEKVDLLSDSAEVFYRRLMSCVDDYGRYDGRPTILRAAIYPLRLDRVSDDDVLKWIYECESAGLVRHYIVSGKPYIEILAFNQRTRSASKFPAPEDACQQSAVNCQQDANNCESFAARASNTTPHTNTNTTPDTRETDLSPEDLGAYHPHGEDLFFTEFMQDYPNQNGRADALREFNRLRSNNALKATMKAALRAQIEAEHEGLRQEAQWWFKGRRWEDKVSPRGSPVSDFVPNYINPERRPP